MIEFLKPLFLYGSIAAVIPFVIHLFVRNQAKVFRFSSLTHLKKANKNKSRRIKLKHIILMLMRMLLIALISLVLSKPILNASGINIFSGFSRGNIVIIWDNSVSMGYTRQGTSIFSESADVLQKIIDTLSAGDKITVISPKQVPEVFLGPYTTDIQKAKDKILREKISHGKANIADSLLMAADILKDVQETKRNIFVVSDMQEYSFQEIISREAIKQKLNKEIPVFFLKFGGDDSYKNITVDKAKVNISEKKEGRLLDFEISLKNFSKDTPLEGTNLSLYLNASKVLTKSLSGEDFVKEKYHMYHSVSHKNAIEGYLELSDDSLPADNIYHFFIPPKKPIPVLVIDGDLNPVRHLSESFFLESAFLPYKEEEKDLSKYNLKIIAPDELSTVSVDQYSLVISTNVASFDEQVLGLLEGYAEKGGVVWFFMGDKIDIESYNYKMHQQRRKKGLMPGLMDELIGDADNKDEFFSVDLRKRYNNNMFLFLSDKNLGMDKIKFYSCYKFKPDNEDMNVKVIASFTNKEPAIIEKKYGEGKSLFFNFTADTGWTNLPLKNSFVPFLYEFAEFTMQQDVTKTDYRIGESVIVPMQKIGSTQGVVCVNPSGNTIGIEPEMIKGNKLYFNKLTMPGLYRIKNKELVLKTFSANLDTLESDIQPVEENRIKDFLKEYNVWFVKDFSNLKEDISKVNEGEPLWDYLLFLILLLLLLENFLANKMR